MAQSFEEVGVRLFDGATYQPARDYVRLMSQYKRVFRVMSDGQWRTLQEIAAAVQAPEASVSARLRDMRKPRFGRHTIERKHVAGGLHQYRLVIQDNDLKGGTHGIHPHSTAVC